MKASSFLWGARTLIALQACTVAMSAPLWIYGSLAFVLACLMLYANVEDKSERLDGYQFVLFVLWCTTMIASFLALRKPTAPNPTLIWMILLGVLGTVGNIISFLTLLARKNEHNIRLLFQSGVSFLVLGVAIGMLYLPDKPAKILSQPEDFHIIATVMFFMTMHGMYGIYHRLKK